MNSLATTQKHRQLREEADKAAATARQGALLSAVCAGRKGLPVPPNAMVGVNAATIVSQMKRVTTNSPKRRDGRSMARPNLSLSLLMRVSTISPQQREGRRTTATHPLLQVTPITH